MVQCYALGDAHALVSSAPLNSFGRKATQAHATREEAEARAKQMLDVYADFAKDVLAIPMVRGVKSATERFAGALDTYTIER